MAHEDIKDRIEELETELRNTKVNKRTEMAVGLLKSKISKLKEELEAKLSKGGGKGEGFAVRKEGDATVGLLGKPSVGKSTLLGKVTNKESKIGAYEFTTLDVIPGLLHFKHTNLQILDLPGIINQAADNRGFGKKVLSVVRACDLVVLVVDAKNPIEELEMLLCESEKAKIRFNSQRPNVEIKRMSYGGISVALNNSSELIPYGFIKQVLNDMKYVNAEVVIYEKNLSPADFVDACYDNLEYKRAVVCLNKIDLFWDDEINEKVSLVRKKFPQFDVFGVSAEKSVNLDGFKEFIWGKLGFIWVYLKERKSEPDMQKPLVARYGDTVEKICLKIHKEMLSKFKYAKVKGNSVKFDWQRVGLSHVVEDKDIIEIYVR